MKVVVSYACELEDIPYTIVELLQNLKENHLPGVEIDIQDAILSSNENKVSEALESMDAARIGLAKIDSRLMDYMSILAGYSKTNADAYIEDTPPPTQQGTQEVVPHDILNTVEDNNVDTKSKTQND
jgi:hypothetical protein|tara:strand:- start:360 stop:740 length:381 start_codon:yes stop_codon:yes gene_type:complete